MTQISGEYLNRLVKATTEWYFSTRSEIIGYLQQGQPYGTKKLSTAEQLDRFSVMSPQDYELLIGRLQNKYRGLPNAQTRVNEDLAKYVSQMIGLMIQDGDAGNIQQIMQQNLEQVLGGQR